MKAIITNDVNRAISGYETIPVLYGKLNLDNIPDNALEEIIAIDFLDHISSSDADQYLADICKKMRMNSTIVLRGHELSILCKHVISNNISSLDYNTITSQTKSLHKVADIINLLKSKNLTIKTTVIKGLQYEISASRQVQN